ncbi:hypothetical protein nbrc107697_30090 [Gordonia crocea]|uniref:SWIM-type domain-containing protein n=2 Tax=Gordonia crocea TaxID=589162 RepID=A0A7I9V1M5_9ACTN|nr:hypothetical protein nbrc107697_30090 [Gordonia crocea]
MNRTWSDDGLSLRAKCVGSGRVYDVVVQFAAQGAGGRSLTVATCTCPVGAECKHAVALLVTESRDPAAGAGGPAGSPWRTVLGGLTAQTAPGPSAVALGRSLGIQFHLPKATQYAQHPAPTIALVTTGKTGSWIKTGIKLDGHGRGGRAMCRGCRGGSTQNSTTTSSCARSAGSPVPSRRTIRHTAVVHSPLGSAPADIWDLLERARDAGGGPVAIADAGRGVGGVD